MTIPVRKWMEMMNEAVGRNEPGTCPAPGASAKIVVTGATGLVGSHLVAELLRRGERGVVLPVRDVRRTDRLRATLHREGIGEKEQVFRAVEVSLNDPLALAELLEGTDTVYHCAARVSLGEGDGASMIETNVEMTTHLVNAALQCRVRRFVHVSSIAALGTNPDGLTDEGTQLESIAGTSSYGIGKFYAENEVWRGVTEGLRAVVVNPGVVLGEGDWARSSASFIPVIARRNLLCTDGVTGYVDVRDLVRAMADLAECEQALGERFVLVGANLSYRELMTSAARVAGYLPPRWSVGPRALGVFGRMASKLKLVKGLSPSLIRTLTHKSYYSGDKVKRYICFGYTPIEDTIARVVGAYLADRTSGKKE